MSSSRLPGKALLPIAGAASVELCVRRACNSGLDAVVATSIDDSDNILVEQLTARDIAVIRGPIDDVLSRFVIAAADLEEEDAVVRVTADNMFPDGDFLDELIAERQRRGVDYLGTQSPLDGLPYGLSAEAFTVGTLRRADAADLSGFDREHVTPAIRRETSAPLFRPKDFREDIGHLRCTLDTYEDYQTLLKVFGRVKNAVHASWRELCRVLADIEALSQLRIAHFRKNDRIMGRLTLGTAQLGLEHYGRRSKARFLSSDDAVEIVREAVCCGVTTVDCARAYGKAEAIVGRALDKGKRYENAVTVITKLDPLDDLSPSASESVVRLAVEASVFRSCYELKMSRLAVLMLHRWRHHDAYGGAIWKRLLELVDAGVIGDLGASVYQPEEAEEALQDDRICHLQIPMNLLDWRWKRSGFPSLREKRSDLFVYARSVFLQGILLSDVDCWPHVQGVSPEEWTGRLDELVRGLRRQNRADLCIAYVRSQKWVDTLVIGVEDQRQLQENVRLFTKEPLTDEEAARVESRLAGASSQLLDPRAWST